MDEKPEQRRRVRGEEPRRRQVVVRFSDGEYVLLVEHAGLVGLAVGAWVGDVAVRTARGRMGGGVGLAELVRLHADVVLFADVSGVTAAEAEQLLVRLDAAVEAVVAEVEGRRR